MGQTWGVVVPLPHYWLLSLLLGCTIILWHVSDCHAFPLRRPFLASTKQVKEFRPPLSKTTTTTTILQAVADMTIQRGCQFYCIHYDLVEARQQQQLQPEGNNNNKNNNSLDAPIVVLHGGPGIPSNYLRPLQSIVKPTREILFWDQLGCGKSDRPEDEMVYSIDLFVNDLVQLLDEVSLGGGSSSQPFHLYGQSFGGILAFEYLKRERPNNCLSVVLSSTPTSVPQVEDEVNQLFLKIQRQEGISDTNLAEAFRIQHQCQTPLRPQPLEEAYAAAGTIFRGTSAIADYVATLGDNSPIETPALVLRGEHDFVTPPCIQGWKDLFQSASMVELQACAHHGLLERPDEYGKTLESFWQTQEQSALV